MLIQAVLRTVAMNVLQQDHNVYFVLKNADRNARVLEAGTAVMEGAVMERAVMDLHVVGI